MPYTGDGRRNWNSTTDNQRSGGLVGWFSGTTGAANALGSSLQSETRSGAGAKGSQKDGITPDSTPTASRRGMNGSGVPVSDLSTPKNSISTASRFMSAISSRFTTMTPTKSDVDIESDEFYNLHIEAALFPNGPPSDRDTFSPAAFKNLHMNAIGLLTRMQAAYRERMNTIRDLQAERSAQQDEVEEAETRSRHLKLQLEDMARKAQEHEQKLKVLMEELAAEKRARAAAEKAVSTALSHSERASMIMEDLGVDEDRRRRRNKNIRKSWKSGASCDHLDDEDISDDENESVTESESVFSRCRSPLPAPSATPSTADTPDSNGQSQPRQQAPSTTGTPTTTSTPKQPQKHPQQLSAFQKIFRGITGDSSSGCPNCKGQDASVAWDTVSLLRDENKHLKQRVSELEVAVEGALDVVNGLGLLQLAK
ncbi:uncharacterized protein CTHT_0025820 [Thermochaetoides thermophila DSM 1495]|uniref:Uncharacterized protein n=1 Tax=Chaetomium thermophilum (strain DSM 1495 / CBS 144.50 / IMI 039719) TaxID=759272 RepID=G0S682_CHATD|nr:hypothetical protein CTHT_0025820 [Thermochaetoides thermophila DSM 1495]EGS20746.1 hypothetical protein CTHT_0025820 [Thermochaetoides thermophila DSM 1495]